MLTKNNHQDTSSLQQNSHCCHKRKIICAITIATTISMVQSFLILTNQIGIDNVMKDDDIVVDKTPNNYGFDKDEVPQSVGSSVNWWRGRDTNETHLQNHPYQGAKYNDMNGMIVDPTPQRLEQVFVNNDTIDKALTQPYIPSEILCPSSKDYGIESEGGNKVLQKIKIGLQKSNKFLNDNEKRKRRSKILCMVYSVHNPHSQHANLRSQAHTWGRKCDGFIGASNFTDHSIGAINLLHMGKEEYRNMWQKIRSIWAYAYNNYKDEYDFFFVSGDDVYVAVENLRAYVDGPEVERLENGFVDAISSKYLNAHADAKKRVEERPRPLVFGTPLLYKRCPNPDGGGGYMLNRAALEIFGGEISHFLAYHIDPREDIFIGGFFCNHGIYLVDTRNENDGGLRFSYNAEFTSKYSNDWSPLRPKILKQVLGYEIKDGTDVVSEDQISFHLKEADKLISRNFSISELMYRYEAVLYDLC